MATKKQSIPSNKSPGIFPSGSDESLGIGSSNLFESSLGNWNNLIKNLGPDDKPRVFISFASNAELVTPSINENGEGVWLPIIDKQGSPQFYIYGCNWVNWTFRVNYPGIIPYSCFASGLKKYTAFWAHKNDIKTKKKIKFKLHLKLIDIPEHFEKDFLQKQRNKPWVDLGTINWNENKFEMDNPQRYRLSPI